MMDLNFCSFIFLVIAGFLSDSVFGKRGKVVGVVS